MLIFLFYIAIGGVSGFISGLLGGGAGLVMMPAMLTILAAKEISPNIAMHLAIGTCMGSCIILGLTSSFLQYRRHAIVWPAFNRMVFGVLAGTIFGSFIADKLPGQMLKWFFGILVITLAFWMLLHKEDSKKWKPSLTLYFGGGFVSALLNSLSGVATFTVPLLHKFGFKIQDSVGTATPLTFLVAVVGVFCFGLIGLNHPDLPAHSWGYIYLPLLIPFSIGSAVFAYLGALTSHKISRPVLKNCYVMLLFIVGIKMLA